GPWGANTSRGDGRMVRGAPPQGGNGRPWNGPGGAQSVTTPAGPYPCPSLPQAAVQGVEQGIQLGRLSEDVRGHPNPLGTPADADVAPRQFLQHALQSPLHRLEADQAAIEILRAGVGQAQLGVFADAVAHPPGQLVDAGVGALGADRLV